MVFIDEGKTLNVISLSRIPCPRNLSECRFKYRAHENAKKSGSELDFHFFWCQTVDRVLSCLPLASDSTSCPKFNAHTRGNPRMILAKSRSGWLVET